MTPTEVLPARARRAAALAGACLALAGCNGVVSDKPWFTAADATGAPVLRQGVWRVEADSAAKCVVHEDQPLEAWPDCTTGFVVRERDVVGLSKTNNGLHWDAALYVLAAGDPPILQLGETEDDGRISYEYFWARASRSDDHGQAVVIQGWRVACGPPPPSSAPANSGPTSLYEGLTAQNRDCQAASPETLRRAAKSTETDTADRFTAHWIRDGAR